MARHHVMQEGLLGPVVETPAPARVHGVKQFGGEGMPKSCPHCHTESAAWTYTIWEGRCWSCGCTWFRTQYTVGKPYVRRGGNPHAVPPS